MSIRLTPQLIFGLGIVLLFSCCSMFVPGHVKKHFTICYTGESTGLDTMINLQGTYETLDIWWNTSGYGKTYNPRWDTSG